MSFWRKLKNKLSRKSQQKTRYTGGLDRPIIVQGNTPVSSQAAVRIHSMRLYQLAQNPELMTWQEELALQQDPSLMRTYQKYRQEVLEGK
ncbi:MAG: hypothetical protein O0X93_01610 [Methanocorpusculum sp.]|nr:hypothetical protein [Methanocorpusculum sp.]MDE2521841.1 hypothetical protein [Methanocorpusculum sp.]MDE2524834.1 hypothetical protein [Methanocorpusculum sp.]